MKISTKRTKDFLQIFWFTSLQVNLRSAAINPVYSHTCPHVRLFTSLYGLLIGFYIVLMKTNLSNSFLLADEIINLFTQQLLPVTIEIFYVHVEFAFFRVKNLLHAIYDYLWSNNFIGKKEVIMWLKIVCSINFWFWVQAKLKLFDTNQRRHFLRHLSL